MMMKTAFSDIVDLSSIGGLNTRKNNDIFGLAQLEDVAPSWMDQKRVLFIGIDFQNDFMENGELAVPNSHKDIKNSTKFLYRNLEKITTIAVSIDTHSIHQIFHPSWWMNSEGKHPQPFTIISENDLKTGKWVAVEKKEESLEYVQQLENRGRMKLCIWPYHCIEGTFGAALENQFSNMIHFHSIARKSPIHKIIKGKDPLSEMYGIIKPEYDKNKYVNTEFLEILTEYDKIFIAGEAKSHCVLESLRQILEHYQDHIDFTSRIYLLNDCTSPIPGFEQITEETLRDFERKYKINIIDSSQIAL